MELKTIPAGDCLGYVHREAFKMIVDNQEGLIYMGTVEEPLALEPKRYQHAWVERGGLIQDWQIMEAGLGGKFSGIGMPEDIWIELYKPKDIKVFVPKYFLQKVREAGEIRFF